jgi:hypothetical protein
MSRKFLPDEPSEDATIEIVVELTRDELAWLDRARAEIGLTREQFILRLTRQWALEQTFGPGIGPARFPPWP